MATNLEKLRAKKKANQGKEASLSTSFAVEGSDSIINNKETEPIRPAEPVKPAEPIKREEPVKRAEPIKPIIPINNGSSAAEKNLGLRLASEEDKRYLDLAPLSRGMTKKAFFIDLLEHEFSSLTRIDINDPKVEEFRWTSLKTTSITIAVPEPLIEKVKDYSAKHMMKYQRYVAYVVNKARISDKVWQNSISGRV